jgi:hypothetical protein
MGLENVPGCVYVKSTHNLDEYIGSTVLSPGGYAWIPWGMAQIFKAEGKCVYIRFDPGLVQEMSANASVEDIPNLPGTFCKQCAEKGIVRGYGNKSALGGHVHTVHTGCVGRGLGTMHYSTRKDIVTPATKRRDYQRNYQRKRAAEKREQQRVALAQNEA